MKENDYLTKEKIKYLVVHCSDTNKHDTAKDIHELHLSFGWDGIGYHKVINKNGVIENGRPEYWVGAHTFGLNDKSLGVCLIGSKNFNVNQLTSLRKVLNNWLITYPKSKVVGHKDAIKTKKSCPNFDVIDWFYNGNK